MQVALAGEFKDQLAFCEPAAAGADGQMRPGFVLRNARWYRPPGQVLCLQRMKEL